MDPHKDVTAGSAPVIVRQSAPRETGRSSRSGGGVISSEHTFIVVLHPRFSKCGTYYQWWYVSYSILPILFESEINYFKNIFTTEILQNNKSKYIKYQIFGWLITHISVVSNIYI